MKSHITVEGVTIGPGQPLFVTAEVGTTCNGDVGKARELIDAATDAGADAVKFMIIDPDNLMSDKYVKYSYEAADGPHEVNMYDMFKGLHFEMNEWMEIRDYAKASGIIFYLTVDTLQGLAQAEELGCPMYKLSSWDIRNYPLIIAMAQTGKPMQIDLGPAACGEIYNVLDYVDPINKGAMLIHATHAAKQEESNMAAIRKLSALWPCPIGWSADSRNEAMDLLALGAGISLVEKRITLDKTDPGHHHIKALEPGEFKLWVANMRSGHRAVGPCEIRPSTEDLRQKNKWFTSICAEVDIPRGTIVSKFMLSAKRPGGGISPLYMDRFIGKKAAVAIKKNSLLEWEYVE